MLRPIGSTFEVEYWSTPDDGLPAHKVVVRWRVVAHEMDSQGRMHEVLEPMDTNRPAYPNQRPVRRPPETK